MTISSTDIVLVTIGLLSLIVLIGVGTFLATRWLHPSHVDDAPFGVIQAGAFALVGLLLGFSFSLSVARYDQRRTVTVREGNTITTTALRAQFLEPSVAQPMLNMLRSYVQARIDFASAGTERAARNEPRGRSVALQTQMWALAVRAGRSDPYSVETMLFIQALNEMIDVSREQAAALNATIPDAVIGIVIVVIVLAGALLGSNYGRAGRFDVIAYALFATMIALTLATILDLDRPQRGFIRVPLDPLVNTQRLVDSLKPVASPTGVPRRSR